MLLVMIYLTSSLDKSMKDTERKLNMLWDNQKIQADMEEEMLLLLKRIELEGWPTKFWITSWPSRAISWTNIWLA
mgnify:CR=1 FL=1